MATDKLKRMGRFELLQLIYQLKKGNEELTLRCREAERKFDALKKESAEREERLCRDYERRIDEFRMQGSAKDLQRRVKKIEEQIQAIQQTSDQEPGEGAEEPSGPNEAKAELPETETIGPQEDGE